MHPVGLGHLPPPRDMRASRMRGTRGEERGKGISRMELDLGMILGSGLGLRMEGEDL